MAGVVAPGPPHGTGSIIVSDVIMACLKKTREFGIFSSSSHPWRRRLQYGIGWLEE